ncbi:MAG: hypothetical protein IKP86_13620 [Anaerolineaceae bacterium]|nr:hypothetical protein [Anaerolineaceae bacterium]
MFNIDVYAETARAFLESKGISHIQDKPVSDLNDRDVIGLSGWLFRKEGLLDEYEAFEESCLGSIESRQLLDIDTEKTRRYYAEENEDDYCDCDSCRHYRARIAKECPAVAEYLETLGIDITKPFHLSFVRTEDGLIMYFDCLYVAFGNGDLAWRKDIGDIEIIPELLYPDPGVEKPFVVIKIHQIDLPYKD